MIRASRLIAVLAIILGVGVPSLAQAAIVETIIDPDTDATLGSITFPALTGDSDAGVLFSYGGFTQADITSISWTISPSTDEVVALDLNALQGDPGCGFASQTNCSNSTLNLTETTASGGGTSCSFGGDGIGTCTGSASLRFVAYVATGAVPETSTWAMLLLGFAGLGYAGYRRTKRTRFQPA
jgi:hypothetical protein